jgi:malonyl CoA-acyl carrier protein transacylase
MRMVKNEGDVQVGGFPPYHMAYRSLVPKESECKNLFVPVCLSTTHIAYDSIRMEPVFMVLAQLSAVAMVMAIDKNVSVQKVDVAALQERLKAILWPMVAWQNCLFKNEDAGVTRSLVDPD